MLGAGPGGYAAAFYAADLGMQVALSTRRRTPAASASTAAASLRRRFLHVAKVIDEARHARAWGVTFPEPNVDHRPAAGVQAGRRRQADRRRRAGRPLAQGEVPAGAWHADGSAIDDDRRRWHGRPSCSSSTACSPPVRHPTRIPSLSIDSPRMLDSTSALELPDIPGSLLVDRRRLHRPGARHGLRHARQQSLRRRDDARDCCLAPIATS